MSSTFKITEFALSFANGGFLFGSLFNPEE
jgi:hypothetical protein